MKQTARLIAAFVFIAWIPLVVQSQDYPIKPVRILVPHPGGGGPLDAPSRGLAEFLANDLGQPFVVENRDGAQGIIGTTAVVKSDPDGYQLLFTSSSVITLNSLVRLDVPYDWERDLDPVAYVGAISTLMMVNPSVPANSLHELLALAKARPNAVTWGTLGTTSSGPLMIGWFKKHRNVQFYMIPYKSTIQAVLGAIAGDVNVVAYAVGQGAKLTKSGKLKAIALIGGKRAAELPEVPTTEELGVDIKFRTWMGLFAPKGTPRDIINRLNASGAKAMKDAAMREKYMHAAGVFEDEISGTSPEKFAAFIREDRKGYEEAVKVAGITRK